MTRCFNGSESLMGRLLYLINGQRVLENQSLREFFDEVQNCLKARQTIKYLVEDGRYDGIETGSLRYKAELLVTK